MQEHEVRAALTDTRVTGLCGGKGARALAESGFSAIEAAVGSACAGQASEDLAKHSQ